VTDVPETQFVQAEMGQWLTLVARIAKERVMQVAKPSRCGAESGNGFGNMRACAFSEVRAVRLS
jgi:hypothetical protein